MILDFGKEVSAIIDALGLDTAEVPPEQGMRVAMILVSVLDKGVSSERRRILDIVARKAMNASALRAEITRAIRHPGLELTRTPLSSNHAQRLTGPRHDRP